MNRAYQASYYKNNVHWFLISFPKFHGTLFTSVAGKYIGLTQIPKGENGDRAKVDMWMLASFWSAISERGFLLYG
jgi:hypothetical protein